MKSCEPTSIVAPLGVLCGAKLRRVHQLLVAAMMFSLGSAASAAEPPRRYLAVLSDGRRIEGNTINAWDREAGTVVLDGAKLAAPERPLRWLRDRQHETVVPEESLSGFVEFACGDRLPGVVVAATAGSSDPWEKLPPYLRVRPAVRLALPQAVNGEDVFVDAEQARRVVFAAATPRERVEPGTVFFRDGRKLVFRSLRWGWQTVNVLARGGGIQRFALGEIAEIHLQPPPAWEHYFRRLAVLLPRGEGTLWRMETADGLVLTASTGRLHLAGNPGDPNQCVHVVQPAWSRGPLWVRSAGIRGWWRFAPHEVPLSQIPPDKVDQRSSLGGNWPWRADRSVEGRELYGAGQLYGWGLGVHAANSLSFPLPDAARVFRTGVALDHSVGRGGCAIARIYAGTPGGPPAWQTPPLVGSQQVADSSSIGLPHAPGRSPSLVLATDEAHGGRPAGADPFDIRDHVNWIEPLLLLDAGQVQAEIVRRAAEVVPAWRQWTVHTDGDSRLPLQIRWDESVPTRPGFVVEVASQGRQVTLTAEGPISDNTRWLYLDLRQVAGGTRGKLEVRVDGRPIAVAEVPAPDSVRPLLVPLEKWQGGRHKVELVYIPGDGNERTQWRVAAMTDRKTRIAWRPLEIVSARSLAGAELRLEPGGTILATPAPDKDDDSYLVEATSELASVTAFRLEVLPHPTLPSNGPGRANGGNFHLAHFRVGTPPRQRRPIRGRYIRIVQPGQKRAMILSEVEVYAPVNQETLPWPGAEGPAGRLPEEPEDRELLALLSLPQPQRTARQAARLRELLDARAENLARDCPASQSSTEGQWLAKAAVDGNREGAVARTRTQENPWWEVDLGRSRWIERIAVWCHLEYERRPAGFTVVVMDENREELWKQEEIPGPPMPAIELVDPPPRSFELCQALATTFQAWGELRVDGALRPGPPGWASGQPGQANAAVFVLGEPVDPRPTGLYFELRHSGSGQGDTRNGIGHFRLLASGDPRPPEAEPIGIEVPLLGDPQAAIRP